MVVGAVVAAAAGGCGGGDRHLYLAPVQDCCRCRFQILPVLRTWCQLNDVCADARQKEIPQGYYSAHL